VILTRQTLAEFAADLWQSYGSLVGVIIGGVLLVAFLWLLLRALRRHANRKARRRRRTAAREEGHDSGYSFSNQTFIGESAHQLIAGRPSSRRAEQPKPIRIEFDTIVSDTLTFFPGHRSKSCRGTVWFARFVSSELPARADHVRAEILFHMSGAPDLRVEGVWLHDWPNRAIEMSDGRRSSREISFAPRQRKCLILAVNRSDGPRVFAFNDESHKAPSLERLDLHLPQTGTVGMTIELTAPRVRETFQFEFSVEDRQWTRLL